MPLTPGTRLGSYEVHAAIGAGGMGEVYRARDARLDRDVAIKVLAAGLDLSATRLARFEQEARAAAALNHPNILAVHDVGVHEGVPFLVMELLEGDTLRARLAGGALPLRKAVDYAVQMARGLAAAHEKWIIHRDLKPENVFVTSDGRVKILDFGLAKLTQADPVAARVSVLPTLSSPTTPGTVLGTVGYMAPEQVRGEAADHRADLFALGAVLYEMLAGRRAFDAPTAAETMTAILTADPPEPALSHAPPAVARIAQRCLEKQPGLRFQTASDLAFALEALPLSGASGETAALRRHGAVRMPARERAAWALAALAVLAAGVPAFMPETTIAPPLASRFEVNAPSTDYPASVAVSPDGRHIAYAATSEGQSWLWLRPLDQVSGRALPGTQGASFAFWAPDGRALAFFAEGKLKRVDIAGGMPQALADATGGRGGTWNGEDVILYTPGNSTSLASSVLMRVPAAGGTPIAVTRLGNGEGSHRWPQFLPDGRRFLYFSTLGRVDTEGVYLGSLDGGEARRILAANTPAVFVPPDRLLLRRGDTLAAVRFDPNEGTVIGEPIPVAQPVGRDDGTLVGAFSASAGVLAYRAAAGTQRRQIVSADRAGTRLTTVGAPDENNLTSLALDASGRRIAVGRTILGNFDVWLMDVSRGVPTRFTFDPALDTTPLWSPDGRRVVYASSRLGPAGLFEKPASGAGEERLVAEDAGMPLSWSPDGRFLLYSRSDPKTATDLWALQMIGERKAVPVVQTQMDQPGGEFSPDNRWLAYESNESGRFEVYVQPFPDAGGKWQLSAAGGGQPRWRRDGKELYYIAADGRLMAVAITTSSDGRTLDFSPAVPLFATRLASGAGQLPGRPNYAVAPDGRFLLNSIVDDAAAPPITVVVNWMTALGDR